MDGDRIFKSPDGAALRFFEEPVKNNFQSEKHGRPLFDNMLYVEVITPGSNESIPRFEVERTYCPEVGKGDGPNKRIVERTAYYDRFKEAVEKYKSEDAGAVVDGTPLDQWPLIDKGTAQGYKALGIWTVEMLSGISDGNLGNLGIGGQVMREQAKQWLISRQFGVPSAQLAADKANLEQEVARLTRELEARDVQIAELIKQSKAATAPAPAEPAADPLSGKPTKPPTADKPETII